MDLDGRYASLRPLVESDAADLYAVLGDADPALWTYMSFGPFSSVDEVAATITQLRTSPGWLPYVILAEGRPAGFASYLRIDPAAGVLEIGSIVFSPALQRTRAATEALYLMIDRAFALGYRRCEWKCDDLNRPSRRAAERLGFTYEGTFRKATHYKGRSRDTAWYAIVDDEWPALAARFEKWLSPANFDPTGRQLTRLTEH